MKVVGIDLAGVPKNESGYCLLTTDNSQKIVFTKTLLLDSEILDSIVSDKPDIVAIDAPLTYAGKRRRCDDMLSEYGAIPVTLKGMEVLAKRGVSLSHEISTRGIKYIEVFSTASAKILGVYNKREFELQKNMMALDLSGDINTRLLSKDELDAIIAAVTGYLYLIGKAKAVGDEYGTIIIPDI